MSFLISVSVLCSLKSLVGNISPQKQVKIQKLLQQFEKLAVVAGQMGSPALTGRLGFTARRGATEKSPHTLQNLFSTLCSSQGLVNAGPATSWGRTIRIQTHRQPPEKSVCSLTSFMEKLEAGLYALLSLFLARG